MTNTIYANSNRLAYSVALVRPSIRAMFIQFEVLHLTTIAELISLGLILVVLACLGQYWKTAVGIGSVALLLALVVLTWSKMLPEKTTVARAMEGAFGHDTSPMMGAPFELRRNPIKDYDGMPCNGSPWGTLSAINLETGTKEWEKPLGMMIRGGEEAGSLNLGGPAATAGGLIFSAAARDAVLRAFDARTGQVIWKAELPAPAQATPMSYVYRGKQYVVIAAGGHGLFGTTTGDSVIAFGLE